MCRRPSRLTKLEITSSISLFRYNAFYQVNLQNRSRITDTEYIALGHDGIERLNLSTHPRLKYLHFRTNPPHHPARFLSAINVILSSVSTTSAGETIRITLGSPLPSLDEELRVAFVDIDAILSKECWAHCLRCFELCNGYRQHHFFSPAITQWRELLESQIL